MTIYNVQLSPTNNPNDVLHPETSTDVVLLSDGKTLTQKLTDLHQELNRKLGLTGGTLTGNLTAPTFIGALNGNASTATKLQTSRQINGVAFDGTKNITIQDATKLPLTGGTIDGKLSVTNGIDVLGKKLLNVQAIQSGGIEYVGDDGLGNLHFSALGGDIRIGVGDKTKRIGFYKPQFTSTTYQLLTDPSNTRMNDRGNEYGMNKEQVDLLIGLSTPSVRKKGDTLEGLYEECESNLAVNTGLVMSYLIDTVLYLYDELHQLKSKEMN